jgi:trans-aconitate 2-methyltransferase
MNEQNDWNPNHYLKFKNERTQPSIDLVNRINIDFLPEHIIDIGCGPGNSSKVLLQRWPEARLTGVDNSPAMIEKAKKDYPEQEWILADAFSYEPDIKFDVVFSSATIQWIPNHEKLFEKFNNMLSFRGVIAIQAPKFQEMELGQIIHSISQKDRWKNELEGCSDLFTYHDSHYYYDLLSDKMKSIDIWETYYIHVMPSSLSIIDWIKSTGLKPYLDRINNNDNKKDFEEEVLNEIKKCYPTQKDGRILFPFKRLFFIGYK